jgi:hypothetical protein
MASGALMLVVGVGTALAAKWIWRIQLRWLWCGALLWAVAVVAKGFIAALTLGSLLDTLHNHLPDSVYLALGSAFIGLLTGITEPVVTLAAGLHWRQLTYDVQRAVGIGLGAGAFEAVYFGFERIIKPEAFWFPTGGVGIVILVPVVERLICIPHHMAVRAMTLYAVATGRWPWFWGGFAILSGADCVAGFYNLSHVEHPINPWLVELSYVPFTVISVLLVRYLWRHWPSQANTALEPTPTAS